MIATAAKIVRGEPGQIFREGTGCFLPAQLLDEVDGLRDAAFSRNKRTTFQYTKGQNMKNETENVLASIDSHLKGLAEIVTNSFNEIMEGHRAAQNIIQGIAGSQQQALDTLKDMNHEYHGH